MPERLIGAFVVALVAALPPYMLLRRSRRGRARSAIGYLAGFGAGLVTTILLAIAIARYFPPMTPWVEGGSLGTFFGPLVGLVWGRMRHARRKRARAGTP